MKVLQNGNLAKIAAMSCVRNTFIHTKKSPDTRGRFSHLMGAGHQHMDL